MFSFLQGFSLYLINVQECGHNQDIPFLRGTQHFSDTNDFCLIKHVM